MPVYQLHSEKIKQQEYTTQHRALFQYHIYTNIAIEFRDRCQILLLKIIDFNPLVPGVH